MKELQQKTSYGCGVYAVSNALLIPSFITEERIEQSKNGNSFYQLNKWLEDDGIPFFIDIIYFDMENIKSSNINGIDWEFFKSKEPYVALLQVKQTENSRWHLVSANVYSDRIVSITDSLKSKKLYSTFDNINEHYYQVSGLFLFNSKEKHNEYAILIKTKNGTDD